MRQESRAALSEAAHNVLKAIEGFRSWEVVGISQNHFCERAGMTGLKQLAQAHYDTLRHKARAENIQVDEWGLDWRQNLGGLSSPSESPFGVCQFGFSAP